METGNQVHISVHFIHGVGDGGMVAVPQEAADDGEGEMQLLSEKIHGKLPGRDSLLVPSSSLQGLPGYPEAA